MIGIARTISIATLAWMLVSASVAGAQDQPVSKPPTPADWAHIATLPELTGVWQTVGPFLTARGAELTPAAAELLAKDRAARADFTAEDHPSANCLPPGVPINMAMPYPIEILLTPGKVTVVMEAFTQVRHFYTDGRPLPEDPDPLFNGTSIGHWEGDTLVVETIGFTNTEIVFGLPHSNQLRIVERYRLTEPDKLEIVFTLTDPLVFTAPWTFTRNYERRRDWVIREYVCNENNRDKFVDDTGGIIDLTPQ